MADVELTLIAETKDIFGKNSDTKHSTLPNPAPTEVDPLAFDIKVANEPFGSVAPKTEKHYELNNITKPKTSDSDVSRYDEAADSKERGDGSILETTEYLPITLNSDECYTTEKSETTDQASSPSDCVFTIFTEKKQKINEEQKHVVTETTNRENKTRDISEDFLKKYNRCNIREPAISSRQEPNEEVRFTSKINVISATSPIDLDIIKVKSCVKSQDGDEKGKSQNTIDEKKEPHYEHINGKHVKNDAKNKRQIEEESKPLSPRKKLCQEIESAYARHDTVINEYIQRSTNNNVAEMQLHTDRLLSEIQTLRNLAQKKEQEWNNILHLKKIKEEILLRLLRKKQVMSFEKADLKTEKNPHNLSHFNCLNSEYFMQPKECTIDRNDEMSEVTMKPTYQTSNINNNSTNIQVGQQYGPFSVVLPPYERHLSQDTAKANQAKSVSKQNAPIAPKPQSHPNIEMPFFFHQMARSFDHAPMGRQGPIKDVKSIIADYRQRHPEAIPKRGRRLRSLDKNAAASKSLLPNDSRMNDLGLFLSTMNMQSQKSIFEQIPEAQATSPNGISFKDVLVKIANMQAYPVGREGRLAAAPMLPPYPEISLHPVSAAQTQQEAQNTTSLLHEILTKEKHSAGRASSAFSPTLARLLTVPEKTEPYTQVKNCGEITITPLNSSSVHNNVQNLSRTDSNDVQLNEDDPSEAECEGSSSTADTEERLVIDEEARGEVEAPRCQGCHTCDAKFVCAGCANQWYCSRQCQVDIFILSPPSSSIVTIYKQHKIKL